MTELTQDLSLAQARSLIDSYAFDLGGDDAGQLLNYWLDLYQASWIRLATIEALYLGRYKAISVEHILSVWLRLGTPNTHFTYEFERLICRKLPKHLSELEDLTADSAKIEIIDLNQFDNHQTIATQVEHSQNQQSVSAFDQTLNLENAFKPKHSFQSKIPIISALGLHCQADWSEFNENNKVIHQFIPLPDVSSFFHKLKTFGEERLEGR
jgi:hypothetical protein